MAKCSRFGRASWFTDQIESPSDAFHTDTSLNEVHNIVPNHHESPVSYVKILAPPAVYTFAESVLRNSIYLRIVSKIIALGQDYATA
jgi:hypothetical protein